MPAAVPSPLPGADAVVEDANDHSLAHVAPVPQASVEEVAAGEPEHLRRVRRHQVIRLLRLAATNQSLVISASSSSVTRAAKPFTTLRYE
jgi:hypothetical protein